MHNSYVYRMKKSANRLYLVRLENIGDSCSINDRRERARGKG